MQRSTFKAWITKKDKKPLLLVDNVSSHQMSEGTLVVRGISNINSYLLPPDTTTNLQPIDQP